MEKKKEVMKDLKFQELLSNSVISRFHAGTSTARAATAGSSRPPGTGAAAPPAGSTRTRAASSGTATRHSKRSAAGHSRPTWPATLPVNKYVLM